MKMEPSPILIGEKRDSEMNEKERRMRERRTRGRMNEISASPDMQKAIIENIKRHSLTDGGPCPCPFCLGTLEPNKIEYIDPETEPWVKVEIDVFLCDMCGFQGRVKKEE
jgi:hypothetical protein